MKTKQRIELAASWRPQSPEHAVKCLRSWVEQWHELAKNTVKFPWSHQDFDNVDKDIYIYGKTVYDQGSDHESGFMRLDYDDVELTEAGRTAKLIVALGPMVQGMMAGIKAVLKERDRAYRFRRDDDSIKGWQNGMNISVIGLAQAYAPYMFKARMTVPE